MVFSPAASALSRRKGSPSTSTNRRDAIPWTFVFFVLVTVLFIFFFLYVNSFNNAIHHHIEKQKGSVFSHLKQLKDSAKFIQQPVVQQKHAQETKIPIAQPKTAAARLGQKKSAESIPSSPQHPNDILILTTTVGPVKIELLEHLSPSSVDYIREMVQSGDCPRCTFYRAEHLGILQGIIKNPNHPPATKVQLGDCPPNVPAKFQNDPQNGCHGPIMEHGMVGWAAGKTGPDFFIDWYKRPAQWWGTQHTVWGKVLLTDEATQQTMAKIWELPAHKKGLTYLDEHVHFTMSIDAQQSQSQQ